MALYYLAKQLTENKEPSEKVFLTSWWGYFCSTGIEIMGSEKLLQLFQALGGHLQVTAVGGSDSGDQPWAFDS